MAPGITPNGFVTLPTGQLVRGQYVPVQNAAPAANAGTPAACVNTPTCPCPACVRWRTIDGPRLLAKAAQEAAAPGSVPVLNCGVPAANGRDDSDNVMPATDWGAIFDEMASPAVVRQRQQRQALDAADEPPVANAEAHGPTVLTAVGRLLVANGSMQAPAVRSAAEEENNLLPQHDAEEALLAAASPALRGRR